MPETRQTLIPYLIVDDGEAALDFYVRAFGAERVIRLDLPGGAVAHAELRLGGSTLYLSSMTPDMEHAPFRSPSSLGGTGVALHLDVDDCDAATARAASAGARIDQPPQDWFYGDRSATLTDPFGHVWTVSQQVRDVSTEDMQRGIERMASATV